MKNKNLIYLALGLGALYFFSKKKEDESKDESTPDVGNGKNDVADVSTSDTTVVTTTPVVETASSDKASVQTFTY